MDLHHQVAGAHVLSALTYRTPDYMREVASCWCPGVLCFHALLAADAGQAHPLLTYSASQLPCILKGNLSSEALQTLTIQDPLDQNLSFDHYRLLTESQPALVSFSAWLLLAVEPTLAA